MYISILNKICHFSLFQVPQVYSVETQPEDDLYECSCHAGRQNLKNRLGKLTDILVYPGTASIVSSSPFVSGGQLVSGGQFISDNSVLTEGQLVASGQFASGSPIFSSSPSASRGPLVSSSTSIGPLSGSASLGPISSGTLASVSGSSPIGSVAGTASLGSVAGSASLGPISGDASLGLLHSRATFKSPIVQYSLNAGPRAASIGEELVVSTNPIVNEQWYEIMSH